MYPSKEKVTCFYCDWNDLKDKAKDHCKKFRRSGAFKLKIVINNMEKFFQRQTNAKTATTTTKDIVHDDVQEQGE